MNKTKIIVLIIVSALSYSIGNYIGKKALKREIEIVEVEKVQERVRTVTRIVEQPDGTKETIIEEKRETDTVRDTKSKEVVSAYLPQWSVGLGYSLIGKDGIPVYTLNIDRRIFADLFAGVYGRTDKELGISLRFEF